MTKYALLKPLLDSSSKQPTSTFERLREILMDSGELGRVQFILVGDAEDQHFALEMKKGSCKVLAEQLEGPDLEFITLPDIWLEIAEGGLSPMDAFLGGKMRIRGDIELAKRLYRYLADGEGTTDFS